MPKDIASFQEDHGFAVEALHESSVYTPRDAARLNEPRHLLIRAHGRHSHGCVMAYRWKLVCWGVPISWCPASLSLPPCNVSYAFWFVPNFFSLSRQRTSTPAFRHRDSRILGRTSEVQAPRVLGEDFPHTRILIKFTFPDMGKIE